MFTDQKSFWLASAEQLKPILHHAPLRPLGTVEPERRDGSFQGWTVRTRTPFSEVASLGLRTGDEVVLDFGEHAVGHLTLRFERAEDGAGRPAQLRLIPAEVPSELRDSYDVHRGIFARSWMNDNGVTLPAEALELSLSQRHALQYVAVQVVDDGGRVLRLTDAELDCVSVVPCVPPGKAQADVGTTTLLSPRTAAMDAVAQRTLRNCMQDVFEDGPKRDRRLWLGDLRLQAQANYVTFRNTGLVKRCLYLLAACTHPDGRVPACVYMHPEPHAGDEFIPDYAFLFGPTLLDYCVASGDWEAGRDLYAVARRQLELGLGWLDDGGVFRDPGGLWLFIDWCEALDRQAAEHATLAYALRETAKLAERLGLTDDAAWMRSQWRALVSAAKTRLLDPDSGLFVSGPQRQVSWASQIWMILAGVVNAHEGAELLRKVAACPGAVRPGCPYLVHHQVEAFLACGMGPEAEGLIEAVWGTMLDQGASTFWEVFVEGDDLASPYRSHLFNSYCHAWSCTPSLWFRRDAVVLC